MVARQIGSVGGDVMCIQHDLPFLSPVWYQVSREVATLVSHASHLGELSG